MIASLKGTVSEISGSFVTLEVQGVGYQVRCSYNSLARLSLGSEVSLVVYTDVREDSINLYGFEDRLEKQVFLLLTRVKGVGAKSASDIISRVDKLELLRAIGAGDLHKLQAVKGIGKKTAERIIVELKDKVAEFAQEEGEMRVHIEREQDGPFEDAIQALVALGFGRKEAERAVQQVRGATAGVQPPDSGQVVKEALRFI
jgi:holliday junction DNA helicase RuvA